MSSPSPSPTAWTGLSRIVTRPAGVFLLRRSTPWIKLSPKPESLLLRILSVHPLIDPTSLLLYRPTAVRGLAHMPLSWSGCRLTPAAGLRHRHATHCRAYEDDA